MMVRAAATEAGKRALRVWIATVIVILIGLTVFSHRERLPEWFWRWKAHQIVEEMQQ
jgi:hypothetical protein